jgi:GT2 family glycosyltransferase
MANIVILSDARTGSSLVCEAFKTFKNTATLHDLYWYNGRVMYDADTIAIPENLRGFLDEEKVKLKEIIKTKRDIFKIDNLSRYSGNANGELIIGRYIHTYPKEFFENAVKYLSSGECDAVGGPLIQKGKEFWGEIIAECMSSKFGVGGTEFRTSRTKQYVQSVAFATYKREVFEQAGLLDESLVRNQDDEFHYRMNSLGYKILMVPEMQCEYFVRSSPKKLFKQYFEYGLYKPKVLFKIKESVRIRHLVPTAFVLYLVAAVFLFSIFPIVLLPLLAYLIGAFASVVKTKLSIVQKIAAVYIFFILHLAYGLGFIKGLMIVRKE